MADVDQLTYGLINPLFATGMSMVACLLGLILATQAIGHRGRGRFRLIVYAALALGGAGVWVNHIVNLIGFSAPNYVLRYAPEPLAASFGVAVLGVFAGLAVICTGRIRLVRLLIGGLLIAVAMVGTHVMALASVRVGGTVSVQPNLLVGSLAVSAVAAGLTVWLLVSLRRLWVAVVAATFLALTISGTHYLAMYGVSVRLGVTHVSVQGIPPIMLLAAVILFSTTVLAMQWFFAAGTATRSDLAAVFATPHRPIDIEQWMIDAVTARIAIGTKLTPDPAVPADPPRRAPVPSWRTIPTQNVAMAVNGRAGLGSRPNTRATVPWVSNTPVPTEPRFPVEAATGPVEAATGPVEPVTGPAGPSVDADETRVSIEAAIGVAGIPSTVDDTAEHGLSAAMFNAARLSEALDSAGLDRLARARAAVELGAQGRATVDSSVAVLSDEPAPAAEPPAPVAPDVPVSKKSRWRNRRR